MVTNAVWKGNLLPTVQLTVLDLPAFADVWGEVSTDHGVTWTRWEGEKNFFVIDAEPEGSQCVFVLLDETPRMFRVAAEDPWEHLYWRSEAFALQPEETEDSGGNRGGSTNPNPPDREPEPAEPEKELAPPIALPQTQQPDLTVHGPAEAAEQPAEATEPTLNEKVPEEVPAQAERPAAAPTEPVQGSAEPPAAPLETSRPEERLTQPEQGEQGEQQTPENEKGQEPVSAAEETAYDEVKSLEAPQNPSGGRQTLLIAGGVAACVVVGVAVAGIGPFRRKK